MLVGALLVDGVNEACCDDKHTASGFEILCTLM